MVSYLKALAVAVDALSAQRAVTVVESPSALTLSALRAADASALIPLVTATGWAFSIVDSAHEAAEQGRLTEDYEPYIVTVEKPPATAGLQVVSLQGFESFLQQERTDEVWQIVRLDKPFATMASTFLPWGATEIFSAAATTKSPRQIVRDYHVPPRAPNDVRAWLPRAAVDQTLWRDPVFEVFADLSAQALMRALAGEIKTEGELLFKGPPHTELAAPVRGAANELGIDGYNGVRAAAAWVYENSRESEQRHGLLGAQFARSLPSSTSAAAAFSAFVWNALDGARLSYQLSLAELTREAIKAQGDLRKAVTDDTAKIADGARQIVTAVGAAVITCIGLFAARSNTATPTSLLQLIAAIVSVYIVSIIATGCIFIGVQRQMRREWRVRLYRFIPEPDYRAMVSDPAAAAERMFFVTAWAGGAIAAIALILTFALPA